MSATEDIRELLEQYQRWLREKTNLREIGQWVEITTPYLDRHNDCLQMYAKRTDGEYVLTDDGYTLQDLELSGCRLDTPKRRALLDVTLKGFGVHLAEGRLEVRASRDTFALKKHNLVQAMLAVDDLFYLAAPNVASLFYEDIVRWLEQHEVRYTPRVKFTGKSGFDHLFDFVIPKSRIKPERIVKSINRPSRQTAESLAFAWIDTREVRPPKSEAYAFLNDAEKPPAASVLEALRSYGVTPVPWSEREAVKDDLAA
jgi:hypothetical protein